MVIFKECRSIVGALQYLTFMCPDPAFAIQQVFLFMHVPWTSHMKAIKRILQHLTSIIDYGLLLSTVSLNKMIVYSDADWAGCPDTHRSTSGYCVFFSLNLISWSSKR